VVHANTRKTFFRPDPVLDGEEVARAAHSRAVTLRLATKDSARLLSNLLGLYMHDMSEFLPLALGRDGRFRYEKLPLYWSEPESHFPFLIYSGEQPAGFVLAARGSPATDNPTHLDVAEFFVLRAYRRTGVGREAAFALWDRLAGDWVVRVSQANRAGLTFWESTVRQYTGGAFTESTRPGKPRPWRVFTFASVKRDPAV
jgi:predicted acetyltransferase